MHFANYYNHSIDTLPLNSFAPYLPKQSFLNPGLFNIDPLDGPCGLSLDSLGRLYVNNYHRNVERYTLADGGFATPTVIDSSHPTGVAVNPATNDVYVDVRTHITAYAASGAPLMDGADPLQIGAGSLGDGYGLAVSSFPATVGRIYAPDHADNTVKVYDPTVDPDNPVQTIAGPPGGFVSLRDSAVAVDRVSGDIYVADTLGDQFTERPKAIIHVFDHTGAYEGRLKYEVIDGLPVGLAVDNSSGPTQGRVYVTSGNTIEAHVYVYPPGAATSVSGSSSSSGFSTPPGDSGPVTAGGAGGAEPAERRAGASGATIDQKGNLRVTVSGKLAPERLPRKGTAPVAVSIGGKITTTDQSPPPRLKTMRIELNRHGRLDYAGLPTCLYDRIQPGSSTRALSACRSALVGRGSFSADITLGGQETYPTTGRLLVFNGVQDGKPVLLGHIYSPRPFSTSFVIVFEVQKLGRGTYGTALNASLPEALGRWGNLTGIEMTLARRYEHRGKQRSYISAGCQAPPGFPGAIFPLARTSFAFIGGTKLTSVLTSTCKARG